MHGFGMEAKDEEDVVEGGALTWHGYAGTSEAVLRHLGYGDWLTTGRRAFGNS
jgi:hypothetical protein